MLPNWHEDRDHFRAPRAVTAETSRVFDSEELPDPLPDGFQSWMPRWLETFEEHLDVTRASHSVNRSRVTAWRHKKKCDWFRERWEEILNVKVIDYARASFARRAIEGTQNPIFREVERAVTNEAGEPVIVDGKPLRVKQWEVIGYETIHETGLAKMFAERRLPEYAPTATGEEQGKSGVLLVPAATFHELLKRVADAESNKSESE